MAFRGLRLFISRKDFPPQQIDFMHDLLKQNGAETCICSNPTCNNDTDFHVIPYSQEKKILEFRNQACNVIGPDCLVRCAKEHRPFPKQGYTCCLAMEGVKILATGFEKNEKLEMEKLVNSMCGQLETKTCNNVNFIIAKDVLAPKYKFSVTTLRKPIVKIDWLLQCCHEHRIVPHEPYKLPPFCGLTICATNVPLEERKEIEDLCLKNGGTYSADLTRKCTHLIAYLAEGDKFKVARRWGTVRIVNRQWFGQCVASKACLDEDLFPVNIGKEKTVSFTQLSGAPVASLVECTNASARSAISNSVSSVGLKVSDSVSSAAEHFVAPIAMEPSTVSLEKATQEQDDDNMFLANLRFYFVGFLPSDLRKYVSMVRDGGGTRHVEFNEKVTHVIVGNPHDHEMKVIRKQACTGSLQVLVPCWLEECVRLKKEADIHPQHRVPETFFNKGLSSLETSKTEGMEPHGRILLQSTGAGCKLSRVESASILQLKDGEGQAGGKKCTVNDDILTRPQCKLRPDVLDAANVPGAKDVHKENYPNKEVFKGHVFAMCESFPTDRRREVLHWILCGGGTVLENDVPANFVGLACKSEHSKVNFVVVNHGTKLSKRMVHAKPVSSHWIRFCLEEGTMLDVGSHVLYQPLQCRTPLPGFEMLRFCVSQYEDKDRLLLRNLCFILGAKFTEKLHKKVTHLLCRVRDGEKYEAACQWGIKVITAEWLFACIAEDKLVPLEGFIPRVLSPADKDAELLGMTQYPAVNAHLSGETNSQCDGSGGGFYPTQGVKRKPIDGFGSITVKASMAYLSERNKFVRNTEAGKSQEPLSDPWDEHTLRWSDCDNNPSNPAPFAAPIHEGVTVKEIEDKESSENHNTDVASVIEGLLAQTSQNKSTEIMKDIGVEHVSSARSTLKRNRGESHFKQMKLQNQFDVKTQTMKTLTSPQKSSEYDDSQMDSQVIGYAEDITGKQLIMERVRTRSMSSSEALSCEVRETTTMAWKNDGLGRLFQVAEANKLTTKSTTNSKGNDTKH